MEKACTEGSGQHPHDPSFLSWGPLQAQLLPPELRHRAQAPRKGVRVAVGGFPFTFSAQHCRQLQQTASPGLLTSGDTEVPDSLRASSAGNHPGGEPLLRAW